jgi:repressor LexA
MGATFFYLINCLNLMFGAGHIVYVAITDEGATVKRFFQEDGYIRLQPENSSMEPIIVDNCSVAGKVVAVFRRL